MLIGLLGLEIKDCTGPLAVTRSVGLHGKKFHLSTHHHNTLKTPGNQLQLQFVKTGPLGRVVRKPVNANPGLKVNRGNDFSSIKILSTAYVLCSLRLLMLKTEGQKI